MLPFKRFTLAAIISLGSASGAIAAPIDLDLANPELLAEALQATFSTPEAKVADIDLSKLNLSYGIQDRNNDVNFLKSEIVKNGAKPIRVPEPSSVLMLMFGLIGLAVLRRRKH